MKKQIQFWCSTEFVFDLNTGSRKLSEVNRIDALIGWSLHLCRLEKWCIGSQQHCAAGSIEANTHLSGTDSGTACVNTPQRCSPLTATALV